jgi:hypothetical protein
MNCKSFIFSVKNPHNIEGKKFSISAPEYAIYCNSSLGPTFGAHSIYVADGCNENASSSTSGTWICERYGMRANQFFTGSENFTAKEIKVFTIPE